MVPFRLALCLTALLWPLGSEARLIGQAVRLDLQAGGFCTIEADGTIPAPLARDGQVLLHERPYAFVRLGDVLPGVTNLGVGVVVTLHDFTPGEELTLQTQAMGIDPSPDTWNIEIGDDGRFWFGRVPDPADHLSYGRYRHSAWLHGREILVFEIEVRPPTKEDRDWAPCIPEVS